MRPAKRLRTPSQRRTALAFPDFARLDTLHGEKSLSGRDAPEIVNFSVGRRALSDGLSWAEEAVLDGDVIRDVFVYRRYDIPAKRRRDALFLRMLSGKCRILELFEENTLYEIRDLVLDEEPVAINYRLNGEDVLLLCRPSGGMVVWNGSEVRTVENAPPITSACVHCERLFVTVAGERNAIWFSDDLDVTNWDVSLDAAGFIEMADGGGPLLKAVEFADRVYVFRRYSIARLTAYADQTEFSLSTLYVSSGRIFGDTVCVCGDRIVFAAQNGIFAFDGVSTVRILERMDGRIDYTDPRSKGYYFEGKYVFSGTSREGSAFLLFYDINTGEEFWYEMGRPVALCPAETETVCALFAVRNAAPSRLVRLIAEDAEHPGPKKRYRSRTVALGARMRIAEAAFSTRAPVTFTVVTDEGRETFRPGGGLHRIKCDLRGRELSFEIEAEGGGHEIYPPRFTLLSLE